MKPYAYTSFLLLLASIHACNSKPEPIGTTPVPEDEAKIRAIHADYINGWLANNQELVMSLLEDNARIQPNRLTPIEGKENIRSFWFPNDGSTTTINEFTTEIISLNLMDSIAVTTHTSNLDWTYKKDTTTFGMIQRGINTTVYRKQDDQSWKIWRSMWTDLIANPK